MKIIIIIIALFWLMNGTGYDIFGSLQAFCFLDGSCYDIKGNQLNPIMPEVKTASNSQETVPSPIVATPTIQFLY